MLLGRTVGTPLSNRWATNLFISSNDKATSYKRICQNIARLLSTMWRKNKETTFWRFTVRINHLRTFECQRLPTTEGANPPNEEFFDAVARLEAGLAQFSDALGQCD
jgi:hypothetical protein